MNMNLILPWLAVSWRLLLLLRVAFVFLTLPGEILDHNSRFSDRRNSTFHLNSVFILSRLNQAHLLTNSSRSVDHLHIERRLEQTLLFPALLNVPPFMMARLIYPTRQCLLHLLTLRRLWCLLLSFSIDYLLLRFTRHWHVKPNLAMLLYSTSVVALVFVNQADSMLVETCAFAAFMFLVVKNIQFDPHSNTVVDNEQKFIDVHGAVQLGVVAALGVWHRLNFVVFIAAPLLQWLFTDMKMNTECLRKLFVKLVTFMLSFSVAGFVLSLADSVLLGNIAVEELQQLLQQGSLSGPHLSKLTVAPYNSWLSQMEAVRDATVGPSPREPDMSLVHPVHTHVLVNIPCLFGPVALAVYVYVAQCFTGEVMHRFMHLNPRYWLFVSCFLLPVICLSLYPTKPVHDMCPLVVPVVPICVIRFSEYKAPVRLRLITAWVLWNAFGVAYYGLINTHAHTQLAVHMDTYRMNDNLRIVYVNTPQVDEEYWRLNLEAQHRCIEQRTVTDGDVLDVRPRANTVTLVVAAGSTQICGLRRMPANSSVHLLHSFTGYYSAATPVKASRLLLCAHLSQQHHPTNGTTSTQHVSRCHHVCHKSAWWNLYHALRLNVYRVRYAR